ncbi:hypothetical protein [Streptomyces viridosporus]|uniref:hypothetical protein n=1 Tax=Streptomyces viridosporus TaxID=67581 RepID=UPI00332C7985
MRRWRLIRRIAEWTRRKRHPFAISYAVQFVRSFDAAVRILFGSTRTVSPRAVKSARSGAYNAAAAYPAFDLWGWVMVPLAFIILIDYWMRKLDYYHPAGEEMASLGSRFYDALSFYLRAFMPSSYVFGVAAVLVAVALLVRRAGRSFKSASASRRFRPLLGWNQVPYLCATLVMVCALVHIAPIRQRKSALRKVELVAGMLIRSLLRMSADRQTFSFGSARRKAVGRHCALVAAALRDATIELDRRPKDAATKIADLALKICHRYAERRWGALLDENQVNGLDPIRNHEPLRLAAAVLLTISVVVVTSLLGVSAAVQPLVVSGMALLTFSSLLGRGPRALELLDSMRGIQRP